MAKCKKCGAEIRGKRTPRRKLDRRTLREKEGYCSDECQRTYQKESATDGKRRRLNKIWIKGGVDAINALSDRLTVCKKCGHRHAAAFLDCDICGEPRVGK